MVPGLLVPHPRHGMVPNPAGAPRTTGRRAEAPRATGGRAGRTTAEAMALMERHQISALVVVDDQNTILGIVTLLALLKAGIS